jgi:hypothetical protein
MVHIQDKGCIRCGDKWAACECCTAAGRWGERQRKRARLFSDSGAAGPGPLAVTYIDCSDGNAIVVDSDSMGSLADLAIDFLGDPEEDPRSESPVSHSAGKVGYFDSDSATSLPAEHDSERPLIRRKNVECAEVSETEGGRAETEWVGAGRLIRGQDGLGAAEGALGDSEWPFDSGPGLWKDQEEWGFLGITFDAETQVGEGRVTMQPE